MNLSSKTRAQNGSDAKGAGSQADDSKSSDSEAEADLSQEITREDLASKLTELRDSMPYLGQEDSTLSEGTIKMLAAGLGLAAAYFYGWRRGRRNTAVIQVKRTNLIK